MATKTALITGCSAGLGRAIAVALAREGYDLALTELSAEGLKDTLAESLNAHGIRYEHFPKLGGKRKSRPDSRNTAWRNASFRGYADYMETEQFRKGIERFLEVAAEAGPTAIMCAEAVWWRCHRSLIADYLKARGVEVLNVLGANKVEPHPYTSAARIVNGELSYRPESFL